jgi:glycerophosphoryl diester phosphodiesterase
MKRDAWIVAALLCVMGSGAYVHAQNSKTMVVGHRGLIRHAPENTGAGFVACLSLRIGFELDIRRSRDGVLVCVHDADVNRTTNGTGKVRDMTLAELRKLDAGVRFAPQFKGERVPTFEEVLTLFELMNRPDVLIALDIKDEDDTIEADIASLVEKHRATRHVVCIGRAITEATCRKNLRAASAKIPIAVLAGKDEVATALADHHADWIYLRFVPTADQVAAIHKAGKRVFLSGPLVAGNEPAAWRTALAAGVDAILTDYPLDLRLVQKTKP